MYGVLAHRLVLYIILRTSRPPPVIQMSRALTVRRRALPLGFGAYRAASGLGRLAGRAYNSFKRSRMSSNMQSQSRSIPQGNVTFQNDSRNLYRRRRAPRRLRRRAKRFAKKVHRVMTADNGQQSLTRNLLVRLARTTTGLGDSQISYGVSMYGGNTDASLTSGDLSVIRRTMDSTDAFNPRVTFKSAVLDFFITNNDSSNGMYLDIYYCIARKSGAFADPLDCWNNAITDMAGITGVSGITSNQQFGVTPFDTPAFGSNWTVTEKKRVFIQPQAVFSFVMKDPADYVFDLGQVEYTRAIRNMTEGVIFIAHSAATKSVGMPAELIPDDCDFTVVCNKTYHWTVNQDNTDAIGQNQGPI